MTIGNRPDGREPTAAAPATSGRSASSSGSRSGPRARACVQMGDTEVLCAATIADRVPPHLRGKGTGWVTAEYSMLPRATAERTDRESAKGRIGGRTHEIQRLIGRSLRGVVDLTRLGERTITVDCDVLQADGGTRTASITGGYVALAAALITYGMDRHLVGKVAAVSVGHRRRRAAPRPRLLGGLARGRRLQRRRHRLRRRTSSCRARPRASRSTARRRTALIDLADAGLASCSRRRPRSSPPSSGDRAVARPRLLDRDPLDAQAARAARAAPAGARAELVSLDELGIPGDPVEDGETFETNAALKARFGARASGLPTLADDSGHRGGRARRRARASGRGGTPARTPPTTTTTRKLLARARRAAARAARGPLRVRAGAGAPRRPRPARRPAGDARPRHVPRPDRDGAARDRRVRLRPDLRAGVASRRAAGRSGCGRPAEKNAISHRGRAARRMAPHLRGARVLGGRCDAPICVFCGASPGRTTRATPRWPGRSAPGWPRAGSASSTAAAGSG